MNCVRRLAEDHGSDEASTLRVFVAGGAVLAPGVGLLYIICGAKAAIDPFQTGVASAE